jgi:hypothetical protein
MFSIATKASGIKPLTINFVAASQNTSNLSTYTFSNFSIGTGKYLALIVGNNASAINSLTIGGISYFSSGTALGDMFAVIIPHPKVTGIEVVVGYSSSQIRTAIYSWVVNGDLKSATPIDSLTDTSAPLTGSIDILSGGILIALGKQNNTTAKTFTAGVNFDSGDSIESTQYWFVGSYSSITQELNRTVSSDADRELTVLSWR